MTLQKQHTADKVILSHSAKPQPLNAVNAAMTLGWRALLKIKHVPFQLFDVTVFPLMMTLMFTYLFGGALAGSPREYIQYLLPGILVQTILFITVYTGVGLNTDISKGIYDRFRSMPIWPSAPVFGALMGDVLRYSIAAVMVIGLGFVLGFRPQGGLFGVVLAVLLVQIFASSLAWIWIIVGMLVKSPESVMTTSFLFLFPLTFASNVFVDPATMPAGCKHLSASTPSPISPTPPADLCTASRMLAVWFGCWWRRQSSRRFLRRLRCGCITGSASGPSGKLSNCPRRQSTWLCAA